MRMQEENDRKTPELTGLPALPSERGQQTIRNVVTPDIFFTDEELASSVYNHCYVIKLVTTTSYVTRHCVIVYIYIYIYLYIQSTLGKSDYG